MLKFSFFFLKKKIGYKRKLQWGNLVGPLPQAKSSFEVLNLAPLRVRAGLAVAKFGLFTPDLTI